MYHCPSLGIGRIPIKKPRLGIGRESRGVIVSLLTSAGGSDRIGASEGTLEHPVNAILNVDTLKKTITTLTLASITLILLPMIDVLHILSRI